MRRSKLDARSLAPMMEAEFFGYEKNAFTGATLAHRGYLERAGGGSLFLDEVGELPASMQAKLLRALQERSFFRLGSEKVTRSEFRIIATTNRDLHAEMAAGTFREDLFYRLASTALAHHVSDRPRQPAVRPGAFYRTSCSRW